MNLQAVGTVPSYHQLARRSIEAQVQGPGIKAQVQGPGIKAQVQGPGIKAQVQGPGIKAQVQGPGIKAYVLQSAEFNSFSQEINYSTVDKII